MRYVVSCLIATAVVGTLILALNKALVIDPELAVEQQVIGSRHIQAERAIWRALGFGSDFYSTAIQDNENALRNLIWMAEHGDEEAAKTLAILYLASDERTGLMRVYEEDAFQAIRSVPRQIDIDELLKSACRRELYSRLECAGLKGKIE